MTKCMHDQRVRFFLGFFAFDWTVLKSPYVWTLKTCNFEALEVTAIYFTFQETSNLFFIWTREVKSVAVCSVYDMLSGIPIGLIHTEGLLLFVLISTVFYKTYSPHILQYQCICNSCHSSNHFFAIGNRQVLNNKRSCFWMNTDFPLGSVLIFYHLIQNANLQPLKSQSWLDYQD